MKLTTYDFFDGVSFCEGTPDGTGHGEFVKVADVKAMLEKAADDIEASGTRASAADVRALKEMV